MKIGNGVVWPMQPGGGLFLVCIGAGLIYGSLINGNAVLHSLEIGFVIGVLGIIAAIVLARGRFGRPTNLHRLVALTAVGVELLAFVFLARSGLFSGGLTSITWLVALSVVNLHFIIMRWSHGPLILWLAIVSQCWIGLAYLLNIPTPTLIAGDGLLKIAFGLTMAYPLWAVIWHKQFAA